MHVERPAAVVMNMFDTGLGIARSLGSRGIPVIGLSAQSGVYGNATRYAKVLPSPDSKAEPEAFGSMHRNVNIDALVKRLEMIPLQHVIP